MDEDDIHGPEHHRDDPEDPTHHKSTFDEFFESDTGLVRGEVFLDPSTASVPVEMPHVVSPGRGPRLHFVNCFKSLRYVSGGGTADPLGPVTDESSFAYALNAYFTGLDYTTSKNIRLKSGDTIVGTDGHGTEVIVTVAYVDRFVQFTKEYWVGELEAASGDFPRVVDAGPYDEGTGPYHWVFLFHHAGGGGSCCTPMYSELKFTATPDDGTLSPALVTWDCLQWDGSQYIGLDSGNDPDPGDYSLQVFYDSCGRGWTAIIEPTNTQSILGLLTTDSGANNMSRTGAAGGTYLYTGGGPVMYGDSAAQVAMTLSFDTHPCNADLVNLDNQLLGGVDVSGLVNASDTLRIYACS